jgi:hypothetical protein
MCHESQVTLVPRDPQRGFGLLQLGVPTGRLLEQKAPAWHRRMREVVKALSHKGQPEFLACQVTLRLNSW